MKIPVIDEIKVSTVEPIELIRQLKKHRVGETTLYCDFTNLTYERLQEVLDIMSHCLRRMNISPIFPYPFYVITPFFEMESEFPLIKEEKQLPKYFDVNVKRMTSKEQKILDKVDTLVSQIKNQDVKKRLEEYKLATIPQRMIKTLAKEGTFLEKLNSDLEIE